MVNDNHPTDEDDVFISKTQRKKSLQQFTQIAEKLLTLTPSQWKELPLTEELINALHTGKKIKVSNAKRRQLSFISKLIRNTDYQQIQARLEEAPAKHPKGKTQAKDWLEKLLSHEDAQAHFIEQHPHIDRQKFNQRLREALKEQRKVQDNPDSPITEKHKKLLLTFLEQAVPVS